jgi:hypothetical protein
VAAAILALSLPEYPVLMDAFANLTMSSIAALLFSGSHAATVHGASIASGATIGAKVVAGRAAAGAVTAAFLAVVTAGGWCCCCCRI